MALEAYAGMACKVDAVGVNSVFDSEVTAG
jgi:hypothetical protein